MQISNNLSYFGTDSLSYITDSIPLPFEPFWIFGNMKDFSGVANALLNAKYQVLDETYNLIGTVDKLVDLPNFLTNTTYQEGLKVAVTISTGNDPTPKELIFSFSKSLSDKATGIVFNPIIEGSDSLYHFFKTTSTITWALSGLGVIPGLQAFGLSSLAISTTTKAAA